MSKSSYIEQNINKSISSINSHMNAKVDWQYEQISSSDHLWRHTTGNAIKVVLDRAGSSYVEFCSSHHADLSTDQAKGILASPAFKRYFTLENTADGITITAQVPRRQLSDRHLGEYIIHLLSHMEPMITLCHRVSHTLEVAA